MVLFDKIINALKSGEDENSDKIREDSNLSNQTDNRIPENFKYFDELIHSGSREIFLEADIVLSEEEIEDYGGGIELDVDNMTINGNGHSIDALGNAKIFSVKGKNISINNMVFLNGGFAAADPHRGITFKGGGAIKNYSSGNSFMECKFINNHGGAIINGEESNLNIVNCLFKGNCDEFRGGAIVNLGDMNIVESDFLDNSVEKGRGGAIFNNSNLSLKKVTLKNNKAFQDRDYAFDGGGAIFNQNGKLKIVESEFADNYTDQDGGAIHNLSEVVIDINNVTFYQNKALRHGNTFYSHGELKIYDSTFMNSESIYNKIGNVKIFDSRFIANKSDYLILNNDQMELGHVVFQDNAAEVIIENSKNLSVFDAEFTNNIFEKSVIFNTGRHCSLDKTEFGQNTSRLNFPSILNENRLILRDVKLPFDNICILNYGEIVLKSLQENIIDLIENQGTIKGVEKPKKSRYDFTCLNNLIHNQKSKEIILNHDFAFEEYETEFFEGGIDLDIDGLTIDGQNHSIDGKGFSRIFIITSKNVTLKNIIFKNGFIFKNYDNPSNNHGGAIRNNFGSDLRIIGCKFIENKCEENGGSITNNGKLVLTKSSFTDCNARNGGSISNLGKIEIVDGLFEGNSGNHGGAIYNHNEIRISQCRFSENSAIIYGGSLYNCSEAYLEIIGTCFKGNSIVTKHALVAGGAIYNEGNISINDSSFYDNELYEGRGPAIWNQSGNTTEKGCVYENNWVLDKDDDW